MTDNPEQDWTYEVQIEYYDGTVFDGIMIFEPNKYPELFVNGKKIASLWELHNDICVIQLKNLQDPRVMECYNRFPAINLPPGEKTALAEFEKYLMSMSRQERLSLFNSNERLVEAYRKYGCYTLAEACIVNARRSKARWN
ncbi:MAG: hypothetical protein ACPL1K_00985 [Candidatus Kryptoniota bacterium]